MRGGTLEVQREPPDKGEGDEMSQLVPMSDPEAPI